MLYDIGCEYLSYASVSIERVVLLTVIVQAGVAINCNDP